MKVKTVNQTIIITPNDEDSSTIIHKIQAEKAQFEDKNMIVDLSAHPSADANAFIALSQEHTANKKSFVLVVHNADMDDFEEIVVVPTLQEAHDIIEMEEIERDLGF